MKNYCAGEDISENESILVSNVYAFSIFKNNYDSDYTDLSELIDEYKVMLDINNVLLKFENDEFVFISDLIKDISSSISEIKEDSVDEFLVSLKLSVKEKYQLDEIIHAVDTRKLILMENISSKMTDLKANLTSMDAFSKEIIEYFYSI